MALVAKTGRMPTVDEVASRAGVARRSVFRYFDGVEALEVETAHAMRALMNEQVPPPDARGSLEERLDALVHHRAQLYDRLTPIRRFLDAARQRGNPAFDSLVDGGRKLLVQQLRTVLKPELAHNARLQPVLELVTSWEAWVALREGQRRSAASARQIMREALKALLNAKATSRGRVARSR